MFYDTVLLYAQHGIIVLINIWLVFVNANILFRNEN